MIPSSSSDRFDCFDLIQTLKITLAAAEEYLFPRKKSPGLMAGAIAPLKMEGLLSWLFS
jgi:hypothetical protein